jgi:hypothetical protein
VQGLLGEVEVEVGAEGVQRALDVGHHQVAPGPPERRGALLVGLLEHARVGRDHLLGDLLHVAAGVAVLRDRPAEGGRDQRLAEPVELHAGVVDVVLAEDLGAARGEDPAECVADRRPPGAADVDGAGGVGRDELQVDHLPGQLVAGAVGRTRGQHVAHDPGLRVRGEAQVDEARPGDLGAGDAVLRGERLGEPGGQVARLDPDPLRGLQGDVRGVVAVLGVARSLHRDVGRQRGEIEVVVGEHGGRRVPDQFGEQGGGHFTSLGSAAHGVFTCRT